MIPARRIIAVLLGLCLLSLVAFGSGPQAPPSEKAQGKKRSRSLPEVVETDIVTREAICRWAAQPPVLDGKLDDKCWEQAAPIEQFAAYWAKPPAPRAGTRAYLVWDDEALYYGATMTDSELRAYGTKRNDSLWDGDVFEMFFKPSAERPEYYEFQANPRALIFECFFPKRGVYPKDLSQAPLLGNKAVVTVSGTLDEPGDRDTGWTVEGRIPWSAFQPTGGKPKPGDEWRFALCRYDYGPKGSQPVLMSSAPLSQPSFHRHEDYAKLRFVGPRE
jgi:hypothetical protein